MGNEDKITTNAFEALYVRQIVSCDYRVRADLLGVPVAFDGICTDHFTDRLLA